MKFIVNNHAKDIIELDLTGAIFETEVNLIFKMKGSDQNSIIDRDINFSAIIITEEKYTLDEPL